MRELVPGRTLTLRWASLALAFAFVLLLPDLASQASGARAFAPAGPGLPGVRGVTAVPSSARDLDLVAAARPIVPSAHLEARAAEAGEPGRAPAQDAPPRAGRAGLVVQGRDGEVRTYCLDLQAESRSGLELLRMAGLEVSVQSFGPGVAVCSIGGEGCAFPAQPCWCECKSLSAGCSYWAYHSLEEEGWRYSALGPTGRQVSHGDVDGWAWGPGTLVAGATPPRIPFEQICAERAAPPSPNPPATTNAPATARPGAGASEGATPAAPARSRRTPGRSAGTPPGAPDSEGTPASGRQVPADDGGDSGGDAGHSSETAGSASSEGSSHANARPGSVPGASGDSGAGIDSTSTEGEGGRGVAASASPASNLDAAGQGRAGAAADEDEEEDEAQRAAARDRRFEETPRPGEAVEGGEASVVATRAAEARKARLDQLAFLAVLMLLCAIWISARRA